MLKKQVTYKNYNGEQKTKDLYFNLSRAELVEWQLGRKETLATYLENIVKEEDSPKMISFIKEIICKSYGVKSSDGETFIKNEEVLNEFLQSEAYSEVLVSLVNNAEEMTSFVKGILPNIEAFTQNHA